MENKVFFSFFTREIGFLIIWLVSLFIVTSYEFINKRTRNQSNFAYASQKHQQNKPYYFVLQIGLAVFVGIYVYLILDGSDFAGGDNSQLTFYSVRGNPLPMPIWGTIGRFFPLAHQEFNIISLFSTNPLSYHIFVVSQLLIIILLVYYFVLYEYNIFYRILIILLIILTPSFVKVFFGLIYSERNVIFWLVIFFASIRFFEFSKSRWGFCIILISTQFALYYKESVFVFFGSFAISRLFIYALLKRIRYWHKILPFIKSQRLEVSLIVLSLIYLFFYLFVTIPSLETT